MAIEPIRLSIEIAAPRTHVFEVLTRELADWWPAEFTFSGDRFASASIDHLAGGEWFEIDADGQKTSWGEVRDWQPPELLVLSWRVAADRSQEPPDQASEIRIRLSELSPATTLLKFEHDDFGRHGEGGASMRDGLASGQGWSAILERLRFAASGGSGSEAGTA